MRRLRENKKLMTGLAIGLCVLALLVIARAVFVTTAEPTVSSEAQTANEALIQQLQQASPPPEPEPVITTEPGSARRPIGPP
jgi:hypothetical protein